jgi:REP element-mobilizing transposase RayT
MTLPIVQGRLCVLPQRIALTDHELASWLWQRLRTMFPDVLAAVLMPDHLHLLLRDLAEVAQQRLRDLVRALRRRNHAAADIRWLPVEMPTSVPNAKHAARQVRYLHLNPCRDGLAYDPLAWPWSTHRDAVGAVAEPWVPAPMLARELARPATASRAGCIGTCLLILPLLSRERPFP